MSPWQPAANGAVDYTGIHGGTGCHTPLGDAALPSGPRRRGVWLVLSGVPTDIIDTPLFTRMTPVAHWDYLVWVAGAALVGLLAVTYVAASGRSRPDASQAEKVLGGGLLSVFAVGCPVCNKLVVLALGISGALTYFGPVQPVLGLLSVVLLLYALRARLAGEKWCPIDEPEG
jgi:hypothetical protein